MTNYDKVLKMNRLKLPDIPIGSQFEKELKDLAKKMDDGEYVDGGCEGCQTLVMRVIALEKAVEDLKKKA